MTVSVEHVSQTIKVYLDRYPNEASTLQPVVDLIAAGVDVTSPDADIHITASAITINESGLVLFQRRLPSRWRLPPGGHLQSHDMDLPSAALRSLGKIGFVDCALVMRDPLYIDRYAINSSGKTHRHVDVRYLLRTTDEPVLSRGIDWLTPDVLPAELLDRVCELWED